jgi:protein TonB
MTSNEFLKADLLDIVFDHRNKSYGAYALRKSYEKRLGISLFFAIAFIGALIFLMIPEKNNLKSFLPVKPDVIIRELIVPVARPVPQPPLQRQNTVQKASQADYNSIKLVKAVHPFKEMLTISEMEHRAIGNVNFDGTPLTGLQNIIDDLPIGMESGTGPTSQNPEPGNAFVTVEMQPEFPGGKAAWLNFLSRHLQVPGDLNEGQKISVMVRFLVDANGDVNTFSILQSGGKAFDAEVIRVLKKMPKWKPAIQNGRPVAVSFSQPVTFVGVEK